MKFPLIHFTNLSYFVLQGEHGIDKDVFLSLPCILNANGVTSVVKQILTDTEVQQLQKSANIMAEVQAGLQF